MPSIDCGVQSDGRCDRRVVRMERQHLSAGEGLRRLPCLRRKTGSRLSVGTEMTGCARSRRVGELEQRITPAAQATVERVRNSPSCSVAARAVRHRWPISPLLTYVHVLSDRGDGRIVSTRREDRTDSAINHRPAGRPPARLTHRRGRRHHRRRRQPRAQPMPQANCRCHADPPQLHDPTISGPPR